MTEKTFQLLKLVDQYNSWDDCGFVEDIESTTDTFGCDLDEDLKLEGHFLYIYDKPNLHWMKFLINNRQKCDCFPDHFLTSPEGVVVMLFKLD